MGKLLLALVGLITPIRITAPRYLAGCLARQGIKHGRVSKEWISELALTQVRMTQRIASLTRRPWRGEIIDALELRAMVVAYLLQDEVQYDETVEGITEEPRAILARYGITARKSGL